MLRGLPRQEAAIPAMAPTERPPELCDFGVGVGLGLALAEIAGSKISL